ncbi:hypothetical protein CHS0354_037942 [Potamilus streckersoni]|uniref:Uncharacterized protein n=1 Tax=Potamilus streckersoni TaxID=2493646 RepID=A0AAE0T9S4_9BIVA|nr:hypothetical protein CHS0354_037942 [Potamilus streckersoni]
MHIGRMGTTALITIFILTVGYVFPLPDVHDRDVCPRIKCPGIEPPECAEPTYFYYKGHICRGCDRNICKKD